MPEQARKLCLLGATDDDLADFFGVHRDTITEWKSVHENFSGAIARGKLAADAEVADRLYQRALGYSHPAVKIFMPMAALAPVYAPYTQHYPPDTAAASLWLRNRRPAQWRDKPDDGPPPETPEEWARKRAALIKEMDGTIGTSDAAVGNS